MKFGVAGEVRRSARGLGHPITLLVVQSVAVWLYLSSTGGLIPVRVPDSKSYILNSRFETPVEVMSYYRTYGYSALLRIAATEGNSFPTRWVWMPPIHFCVFFAATLIWWAAVKAFTGSRWLAFAAATPLLYVSTIDLVNRVQPDFLAAAFVMISLALLLLLVVRRGSKFWLLVCLGLSLFSCYQLRPAGVFLLGLIPVMFVLLSLVVERASLRSALRAVVPLALVCVAPFLAYSGLRAMLVGHFGLVSFGGPNLTGTTANFVDAKLLDELPAKHRELATIMLRMRERKGWLPMRTGVDPMPWFEQYSENIFQIALPAVRLTLEREAAALNEAGDPVPDRTRWWVVVNQRLTEFSRSVIQLRPRLYLRWVTQSIWYGFRQLKNEPWVLWPFMLFVGSTPYALVRHRRGNLNTAGLRPVAGLGALGTAYFCGYLLLVSLVSHPFQRYLASMVLLLPGCLCAALVWIWTPRIP